MNDGYVGGITAAGSASVAVLGGRILGLSVSKVSDTSVITLSGGSVRGLTAEDSSSVILAGGTVTRDSFGTGGLVLARDSSSVVLNAGSTSLISMQDSSSIVMSGGEVSERLSVNRSSRAEISGGTIDSLYLSSDSPASITGGVISSLEIAGSAPVSITGGTIGLLAGYYATVTLEGGTVSEMHVLDDSTLLIEGSGFAVDGIPVPHGDLAALTGTLTGTLASGDTIHSAFTRECFFSPGTITLIPEPSTALLLACGLAGFAAAGRQRSRHSKTTPADTPKRPAQ
jgi:hypothetical protein